ncbi:MAG: 16S rRNA (cytosine(1402)-N(4))-methyltransferase, partial [Vampirovibrionales bacterium]
VNVLDALPQLLTSGATVTVLTFHSLEDRLVKQAFKRYTTDEVSPPSDPMYRVIQPAMATIEYRKARLAQEDEIAYNPRARSAKLRSITWR